MDQMYRHLPKFGWEVVIGFAEGRQFHNPEAYRRVYPELKGIDIDGRDGTSEGRVTAVKRAIRKVNPKVVIPLLLVDANMAITELKHQGSHIRHLYTYQGTHDWNIAEPERYSQFIDMCCGCNVLATETLLERGSIPEERLASVPNGVPSGPKPAKRPLNKNVLQLAYAGRIEHPDKRVFDIPRILDVLDREGVPYHLSIAGSGPQDVQLKKMLAEHMEKGKVTHLGRLMVDELYDRFYSKTDILLFPSPWEGWPLVVGEAISAGVIPAAAAFRGSAKEQVLIPDYNAIMYQVGDPVSAGRKIAELARHPDRLNQLSLRAFETSQQYSWERCAERWSDVIERTLSLPPVRGKTLPQRGSVTRSRFSRLGVPLHTQMVLRRLLGRQVNHSSSRAEWPQRDEDFSTDELQQIEADLLRIEQQAISCWPAPYCNIRSLTRVESQ